jgi:hypothetical protein
MKSFILLLVWLKIIFKMFCLLNCLWGKQRDSHKTSSLFFYNFTILNTTKCSLITCILCFNITFVQLWTRKHKSSLNGDDTWTTVTCHSSMISKTGYYRTLPCSQIYYWHHWNTRWRTVLILYLTFTENLSTHPIIHYSQWGTFGIMLSLHLQRPYGLWSSGKTTGYNHNDDGGSGDLHTPFLRQDNTGYQFITVRFQLIFTLNKVSLNQYKDKLGRISSVTKENQGDWDSIANTATCYGLKYPEFKPCGGTKTSLNHTHPTQTWVTTSLLYNRWWGLSSQGYSSWGIIMTNHPIQHQG